MHIPFKSTHRWDIPFFEDFIDLRHQIYQKHPDYIPESLTDYSVFFEETSYFSKNMDWLAVLIPGHGRYLLCQRPDSSVLNLGYFECHGSEEVVMTALLNDVHAFRQKYPQLNKVRGPIQGSLFAGYRFREVTSQPRFLGESLHLDHYPEMWKKWGFKIEEHWDSFMFDTQTGIDFYRGFDAKLGKFWKDPKIGMRPLDKKNWNDDLKRVFEITMEAYGLHNTNDAIDFKIFKHFSDSLKPLLQSHLVQFLTYDNNIIGFTISYPDIQGDLRHFNRRKDKWPLILNKLILFADIQFRKHPLMMVYVAKRKDCPIKWAMAKMGSAVAHTLNKDDFAFILSILNAESSGSRSSLPENKKLYSRHFLMELPLP